MSRIQINLLIVNCCNGFGCNLFMVFASKKFFLRIKWTVIGWPNDLKRPVCEAVWSWGNLNLKFWNGLSKYLFDWKWRAWVSRSWLRKLDGLLDIDDPNDETKRSFGVRKNSLGQKWPKTCVTVKPFLYRITDFINLFNDFLCAEFNNFHIFISIIFPNLELLWQSFHFILAISHFCYQIKDFNLSFCLKNNLMGISGNHGPPLGFKFEKVTLIDMLLFIAVMTQLR